MQIPDLFCLSVSAFIHLRIIAEWGRSLEWGDQSGTTRVGNPEWGTGNRSGSLSVCPSVYLYVDVSACAKPQYTEINWPSAPVVAPSFLLQEPHLGFPASGSPLHALIPLRATVDCVLGQIKCNL